MNVYCAKGNGWVFVQKCIECNYISKDVFILCCACGLRQPIPHRLRVGRWTSTTKWWDFLTIDAKGYWELKEENNK